MYRRTVRALAAHPDVPIAPETTPVKFHSRMIGVKHALWYDGKRHPYNAVYREKSWQQTWPSEEAVATYNKDPMRPVMHEKYSREALQEALRMIPPWFRVSDVARPPDRIRAVSEGIVGRWYSNYWTLHSVKFQCLLAGIPWLHGERDHPISNFEEPDHFVDFEESKAIRDYRTRWINVNRSMVGMSKQVKEAEEDNRFIEHKRIQELYWSNRKVLVQRVKAMRQSGMLKSAAELPIKSINIHAFD